MFRLDSSCVYRADALEQLGWLDHGFGTRDSSSWPNTDRLTKVRQIHSARVLRADHPGDFGEGDALITNQAGVVLSVRTADCLPILIADSRNRAVAAAHAGWRGVTQEIVVKTLEAMQEAYSSRPEDLTVAIGPGIGVCCFEVGPEVTEQFLRYFPDGGLTRGRTNIDLAETIHRQLGRNGVTMRQIGTAGLCTLCQPGFHSYRRDREAAGRMVTTISIRT